MLCLDAGKSCLVRSEESAVGKIIKGLAGFSEAFASKSKRLIGFLCTNS